MTIFDIIELIIYFIVIPPLVFNLTKILHEKFKNKPNNNFSTLDKLRQSLDEAVDSLNSNDNQINLTDIENKRTKILNKLSKLTDLISKVTGIPIVFLDVKNEKTQETTALKLLKESEISSELISEHSFIKEIALQLILKNKLPCTEDFNFINDVYKKYKKLNRKK